MLVAQAAQQGGSDLALILAGLLGGGVLVAVVTWLRERGKDEATRKSIVEDVNEIVWKRAEAELERTTAALEAERSKREALEAKVQTLTAEVEKLHGAKDAHYADLIDGLLEAIPDAVIQAESDGRVSHANSAAHTLFGYELGKMVGMPLTALMPERYRDRHRAGFENAVITGTGPLLDVPEPVRLHALRSDDSEREITLRLTRRNGTFTAVARPWAERRNGPDIEAYEVIE